VKPTLITGASGFLGWHVAHKLIQRGHTVRALVRPAAASANSMSSELTAICAIRHLSNVL
jgi:dihydroflavonol-4-reductase